MRKEVKRGKRVKCDTYELRQDVESKKSVARELVICKPHNTEEDCENDESSQLDGLTTDGVDRCD